MLLCGCAGDEHIVDVDEAKVQPSEDVIHKPLESLTCVAQAKRHADEFEQSEWSGDGGLGDISGLDGNLMVCSD